MTLYKWDRTTPGNNATADATINWSEGQSPSSVNDSSRAMMTAVAKYRDDISGNVATTGSAAPCTAYTLGSRQVFDTLAHMDGAMVGFTPHANCGATVTLNVDTLGAKPLRTSPGVELGTNALIQGTPYQATYKNSDGVWYLNNVYNIAAAPGSIVGSQIATNTVAYSNIQQVTNARLLGNFAGSTANVSEYATVGVGASGSTLTFGLPAQSSFRNLSIKVATNTTVTVAADLVVMYDGTSTQTTAISSTLNFGTIGAVNGLDAGSIAVDTWYYIYAINNGTTTGALASTSSTAPTMPSGYTWKARIGAVQTVHATATLYGTWQLGRRARYVVGLAQTTGLLPVISGVSGSVSVPTWTATATTRFVPTTASMFSGMLAMAATTSATIMAAPSNSYGNASSTTNPPPILVEVATAGSAQSNAPFEFLIESSNIYYAANAASGALYCMGWEDNI